MQYSAQDIAALIHGQVVGDPNRKVTKFSKIEEADSDSICFFANEKYAMYLEDTKAAILLVTENFSLHYPKETTLIKCKNPYEAAAKLLEFYQTKMNQQGVEALAFVHPNATTESNVYIAGFAYISDGVSIGENSKIFPHVYLGKNAKIGKNVVVHSGVKIYEDCIIGDNCILHSGAVIGSDGFGFAPTADGSYSKIPQIGNVILEEYVEVGANTVIDRATMGSTKVMAGTKLDNLIQIAHNVVIGKNTVIAAQTGISGSTKIGDNVMVGGQAGFAGHINIGNNSKIGAQSGVPADLPDGSSVTGSPSWDYIKMMKSLVLLRKLPDLFDRVMNLEKKNK